MSSSASASSDARATHCLPSLPMWGRAVAAALAGAWAAAGGAAGVVLQLEPGWSPTRTRDREAASSLRRIWGVRGPSLEGAPPASSAAPASCGGCARGWLVRGGRATDHVVARAVAQHAHEAQGTLACGTDLPTTCHPLSCRDSACNSQGQAS